MNNETRIDSSEEKPENGKTSSLKEKLNNNRHLAMSGGLGAVLGAGAGLASSQLAFAVQNPAGDEIVPLVDDNYCALPEECDATPADLALGIDDSMSFNDAFKAARQEVGEGGVFVWRDNLYNTYYKEEWDSMGPEERSDFFASVEVSREEINEFVQENNGVAVETDSVPENPGDSNGGREEEVEVEVDTNDGINDDTIEDEDFSLNEDSDFDADANIGEWVS